MKIPGSCYLVGGAVRDELLGLPVTERDWLVVGATEEQMAEAGFLQVGKHFPVFLHPKTKEEYALARKETKTGPGHGGFDFESHAKVTLEQDLWRRDLTINAMAKSPTGELIDPYGGQQDLEQRLLKHVSDAFVEDPLRCLRVARFAAKFPEFSIAAETVGLIRSMQRTLSELPPERVWNEWMKATQESEPTRFYEALRETESVNPWFSDLDIDCMTRFPCSSTEPRTATFAYIGWNHDEAAVSSFFDKLMSPKKAKNSALSVCRYGSIFDQFQSVDVESALDALEHVGAFHSNQTFENFLNDLSYVIDVDIANLRHIRSELRSLVFSGEPSKESADRLRIRRLQRLELLRK